jgi:hypothetical protein
MTLKRRLNQLEDEAENAERPQFHVAFVNAAETDLQADPPRFATMEAAQAWAGGLPPRDTAVFFKVVNPERRPDPS